jgi:hypothetical protein
MAHMYIHQISVTIRFFFLHISILLGRLAVPDPTRQLQIQWKKTCGVVGYNTVLFFVLNPKILLYCIVGYSTPHKILFWCRIQGKKNSCVEGYNGKKFVSHPDNFTHCISQLKNLCCCIPIWRKTFSVVSHKGKNSSVVSHNGKKPLPVYPTMTKNLKLK